MADPEAVHGREFLAPVPQAKAQRGLEIRVAGADRAVHGACRQVQHRSRRQ